MSGWGFDVSGLSSDRRLRDRDDSADIPSWQAEAGRVGVELMTAWSADDEDHEAFRERLRVLLEDTSRDGGVGLLIACAGLADVAGFLLLIASEVTGRTEEEILQEIGECLQPGAH